MDSDRLRAGAKNGPFLCRDFSDWSGKGGLRRKGKNRAASPGPEIGGIPIESMNISCRMLFLILSFVFIPQYASANYSHTKT